MKEIIWTGLEILAEITSVNSYNMEDSGRMANLETQNRNCILCLYNCVS
jgi:hypothetical protein